MTTGGGNAGLLLGILGGGQLGRMLALAAAPLGIRVRILDPDANCCAGQVAEAQRGNFGSRTDLERFATDCDLFTYEWENVPAAAAQWLESHAPVYPPPALLEIIQDRFQQKSMLDALGVAVPNFVAVNSLQDLRNALEQLGIPALLKTRRHGYDGKGQFLINRPDDISAAWEQLGSVCQSGHGALILESFVSFVRELSLIAVRSRSGQSGFYPLGENVHRNGILHTTRAPALESLNHPLQNQAQVVANKIFAQFDYTGVLAIEFFELDGNLLVNEVATRVHNSGHWTLDGAATSQFENHLRAILGLPLGPTEAKNPTMMLNIIGTIPSVKGILTNPSARLHLYGKIPRSGRKLGHINYLGISELPAGDEL